MRTESSRAELLPWMVWISWLEHQPIQQNVGGSIPCQDTYLGFRFILGQGVYGKQPIDVSLSHWCLSLSCSLSKINKHILNFFLKRTSLLLLYGETIESSLSLSLIWANQKEVPYQNLSMLASWSWISQPPLLWLINACHLTHLIHGILF